MSVTYEVDGSTIALRLRGEYTTAAVRATALAAFADPDAAGATGLLFDVSHSRSIAGRSASEVRAMADFLASHAERFGRRLALVASSDAAFGLMRLGAVGLEQKGVDSRVFRDLAEAEAWLGQFATHRTA
ncbi:MAG: STAS/SEC14 domain-containing protein [Gemmatimonadaceae bacterium]